ncbi:phospholipid carrier-dependent glycosyltransferase [Ktedonospora formicarum]|uniref:ArnT-like N-terminal domain-containing protein n=1 Tax=Ktedonospora formicarum TaxID=2778364 RepID=A0A8J3MQA8_9CHLR|nr:phospholipid carrier-dependent glycosyltransferase [Ktedonospora formicarum]GHO42551.1 hypothetical protein KSX_07140 [Ktedonospora formicarum]
MQRPEQPDKPQQTGIQSQVPPRTPPIASAKPPETPPLTDKAKPAKGELDPGNVTLYRNSRFFVHAVIPDKPPKEETHEAGNTSLLEQIRWLSAERQRITLIRTRLLPRIDLFNPSQRKTIVIPLWIEGLVVALALGLTLWAHALNMFNFPLYGPDEGAYMANAWALIHGNLQPYPYTYDHPPVGWMQIALWTLLTGGFFSFETAINSGRVMMLALSGGSALLLYLITRRLSGSRSASLLALAIFALSPLAITYQREVLLDNIGTFWLLLSIFFVVHGNSRLRNIIYSALALGIAILSQEVFIVFVPIMLYSVWLFATRFQRKFALVAFGYIVLSLSSAYALLAIMKGELFPPGILPGDTHAHPSLLGTLFRQAQYTQETGNFANSWETWMRLDLPFFIAGALSLVIHIIGGWWNRLQWLLALFVVSYWLMLLAIQNIFPFSILPILPLLTISIVMALNVPLRILSQRVGFDLARALLLFLLIGAIIPFNLQREEPQFSQNNAEPQRQALMWINRNVPQNSVLIINSYLYTDLHESGSMGAGNSSTYPRAHIYWNAAFDPEVHDTLLHNCWNNIDYLVIDTNMLNDIQSRGGPMLLLDRALHRSILRTEFNSTGNNTRARIQIYQVAHDPHSCT